MGNILSTSNDNYEKRISELSKNITTAHSYDNVVTIMFNDGKFNMARVQAWYHMSCDVHHHLPVDQHLMLNHYFFKWMAIFVESLPQEGQWLQAMKESWLENDG